MNRSKLISTQILTIALVQIFAVAAFAVPVWSGPGTTFQEWSFGDGSVTPSPDNTVVNPNGAPTAWIGGRAVWSDNGGTWALNRDEMDLFIPNNPELNARKEMQIEIEWMPGSGQSSGGPVWPKRPLLSVYPEFGDGSVVFPDISLLSQDLIGAGAPIYKTIFGVTIEPNPVDEWVIFKGDIVVDHVAISTRCIPEPATFGLLISGAFMAIRRKSKVQR